jgi:hypothetical protein
MKPLNPEQLASAIADDFCALHWLTESRKWADVLAMARYEAVALYTFGWIARHDRGATRAQDLNVADLIEAVDAKVRTAMSEVTLQEAVARAQAGGHRPDDPLGPWAEHHADGCRGCAVGDQKKPADH